MSECADDQIPQISFASKSVVDRYSFALQSTPVDILECVARYLNAHDLAKLELAGNKQLVETLSKCHVELLLDREISMEDAIAKLFRFKRTTKFSAKVKLDEGFDRLIANMSDKMTWLDLCSEGSFMGTQPTFELPNSIQYLKIRGYA